MANAVFATSDENKIRAICCLLCLASCRKKRFEFVPLSYSGSNNELWIAQIAAIVSVLNLWQVLQLFISHLENDVNSPVDHNIWIDVFMVIVHGTSLNILSMKII